MLAPEEAKYLPGDGICRNRQLRGKCYLGTYAFHAATDRVSALLFAVLLCEIIVNNIIHSRQREELKTGAKMDMGIRGPLAEKDALLQSLLWNERKTMSCSDLTDVPFVSSLAGNQKR